MISVSGKKWEKQKVNKNLVEKAKQDYSLGDILSQLIISKNLIFKSTKNINCKLNNLTRLNPTETGYHIVSV